MVTLLFGCAQMKDPQFKRLDDFGVKSFGIQQVEIGFSVTYFNPNSFGVTVKEAAADVYVDSVFMGKFSQNAEVPVSKNAEFSIPFSGKVPLANALKLKLGDLSNREVTVKADGTVKVGKAGIFVSRPFNYAGKHKVNLKL
jgi:LEA14-like dessication related protein